MESGFGSDSGSVLNAGFPSWREVTIEPGQDEGGLIRGGRTRQYGLFEPPGVWARGFVACQRLKRSAQRWKTRVQVREPLDDRPFRLWDRVSPQNAALTRYAR